MEITGQKYNGVLYYIGRAIIINQMALGSA